MITTLNIPILIEAIAQALIALTSLLAVWMVTRNEPWSKWGYVVGLVGQPFWLYSTLVAGQFGMFLVSALYTWFWAQEIWNEWFSATRRAT
jgi:hypothetical protein